MGVCEALFDIACKKGNTNKCDLNLMISCPMPTDLYPLLKTTDALHLQVKGQETGWF